MENGNYSELLLRFELPREPGGPYEVEAMIDGLGLWTGGKISISSADLEVASDPRIYGRKLWDALTAWSDFEEVFSKAWGAGQQRIRLRLMLDKGSPDLHRIKWEFLLPKGDDEPAGVSPFRPVSRFLPLPTLPSFQAGSSLRILLAIANPSNLKPPLQPIDVNAQVASLLAVLASKIEEGQATLSVIAGQSGLSEELKTKLQELNCEIVPGPTSAPTITAKLAGKDVLHLIAHGDFKADGPWLALESERGELEVPSYLDILTQWTASQPRLVFLQSCRSDSAGLDWPSGGLGPMFLERGVPAVVAMRDFVGMDASRCFSAEFYSKLLETGEVDLAANAGRRVSYKAKNGDWAIPVLYSRLRAGERLWYPDPLRQSIQMFAARMAGSPEIRQPFPVEVTVVKNVYAVQRELDVPSSDGRVDALVIAKELLKDTAGSKLVVLLGERGRAKSSSLKKLFVDLARDSALNRGPCPLLVRLAGVNETADETSTIFHAWKKALHDQAIDIDEAAVLEQLDVCPSNLLVDADGEIGQPELGIILQQVQAFANRPNRSALITMDQSVFQAEDYDPNQTTVLVIRDLRLDALRTYLKSYRYLNDKQAELPQDLQSLLTGPFQDIAGVPWLLSWILQVAARDKVLIRSRYLVLDRIVRERLVQLSGIPGGKSIARTAMQEMAWRLHSRRALNLSLSQTYSILSDARGTRDFPLDEFRNNLLKCSLLVPSGQDCMRFAYPGVHAYFAACYLSALEPDDLAERLRGITAGLARLERLRLWQDVLLLLSGKMDKPGPLIEMLLDVGFGEGEHLLVAARCVHEARSAGKTVDNDLVARLTDSLIWWSSPQNAVNKLSPRLRQRAVEGFEYLLGASDLSQAGIIASKASQSNAAAIEKRIFIQALTLVLERVRIDTAGTPQLDFSDVRLAALSVLFGHRVEIRQLLNDPGFRISGKDQMLQLVSVWERQDRETLCSYLNDPAADPVDGGKASDPAKSLLAGLAAFTLAAWGTPESLGALVERFCRKPVNADLHWMMTDALVNLQAQAALDLVRGAIKDPNVLPCGLTDHVVYAVGKLGGIHADPEVLLYLKQHLKSDDPYLQGRSMRAFAEVLGTTLNQDADQLRLACHKILERKFGEARRLLGTNPDRRLDPEGRHRLCSYALQALTCIGDATSLHVLREFYLRPGGDRPSPWDEGLRKNSWEVAEQIRLRSPNHGRKQTVDLRRDDALPDDTRNQRALRASGV